MVSSYGSFDYKKKKEEKMKNDFVSLPAANEISKRLDRLEFNVEEYIWKIKELYGLICKEGGNELSPRGIVTMLTINISKFMEQQSYPPAMENILHSYVPQIIDVLIDDKKFATKAISFHKEVRK